MKTYCGSGHTTPCSLNFTTSWRWVASFMQQKLYPQGTSPWYPLDRKWMHPRASLDIVVKRKISLPLLGIKPQSSRPYSIY